MTEDDEKPATPGGAPATMPAQAPPKTPPPFEDTHIDWDQEVGAWDGSFPFGDEPTRPGGPLPPAPDSEDLVLDDLSAEISVDDPLAGLEALEAPTSTGEAPVAIDETGEKTEPALPAPVGVLPAAPLPREQESSSVLIIPDVEALEAAAAAPGAAPVPGPSIEYDTTPSPESVTQVRPRYLEQAGPPDLADLFAEPTPVPVTTPERGPGSGSSGEGAFAQAFEEDIPTEEAAPLALGLPPVSWVWSGPALAEDIGGAEARRRLPDKDTGYWRAQLGLAVDELGALQKQDQPSPADLCRAALRAARAAERIGRGDALRFYDQALAFDATCATALRGRFRLLQAAGEQAEARAALVALGELAPGERPAYRALLEQVQALTLPAGDVAAPAAGESATATIPELVVAIERAFAAGDRPALGRRLGQLAAKVGGAVAAPLRTFGALVLEQAGLDEEASSLRWLAGDLGRQAGGLAALRSAVRVTADDDEGVQARIERLKAAAAGVGDPLARPILRWASRLARARAGQTAEADALAARAADEGDRQGDGVDAWLPLPDVLSRAVATGASDPRAALDAFPADARSLLLHRLIGPATERDPAQALALVTGVAEGSADGDPVLGLAAEAIAARADDPTLPLSTAELQALRLAALTSWARLDPSRAAVAELRRAKQLLNAPETRDQGLAALARAADLAPTDALAWALSWQRRKHGQEEAAAEALLAGAAGWENAGADRAAAALRDRAAELSAAAHPDRLLARLPVAGFAVDTADDPRALARELVAGRDVRALAETWKSAATAGSSLRLLEAAGWLLDAGQPGAALSWLLDADSDHPTRALFLRRLVRLAGDPATQVAVLGDLPAEAASAEEQAETGMLRAQALELAGRRREAAGLYRELLAGPLTRDADLALRRTLWALRDAEELESLWRDEHDAQEGAGRLKAAAAAMVEKARVAVDLRGAHQQGASDLATALREDGTQRAAQVMLLAAGGSVPADALVPVLEALAGQLPATAASLLFFAGLLAEARGHNDEARRLLREGFDRAGKALPLALARRLVVRDELAPDASPAAQAALFQARAERLATTPGADARLAAALFLRAADLDQDAGHDAEAEALTTRALGLVPEDLPALVRLRRLRLARGAFSEAVDALVREAAATRGAGRPQALHAAAAIAMLRLDDRNRARALLEQALAHDPADITAFRWLRGLFEAEGDASAVAALLSRRAAGVGADEASRLRLERVDLLLGPVNDRRVARAELRALVEAEPENAAALGRLAVVELEDGDHAAAAALSIRQARLERDPAVLTTCFLRIGRLYLGKLDDLKIATGAYERVLRIDADRTEALEALSELYARAGETRKALAVTERLVEQHTDPLRRRPFLLRLGTLWEAAGDVRRAGVMFRRAVDESPRDLAAVGELARFHERHRELTARNVLLDGSLALLREDMRRARGDLEVLRTMIPVLRWRQRRACAVAAAQLLARFSHDPAEQKEAAGWAAAPPQGRRLASLANPELDGLALPRDVQAGVRHLLRMLGPALRRANRTPDLRRWEVGRGERLGKGTLLREGLDALGADLGVREFEAYVPNAHPVALAVEPGDPPAVVLGAQLLERGPSAVRFVAGYSMRLLETHFDLLLERGPMEAAATLAAIIRHFLPEFRPPFIDPAALVAAEARVARPLSKTARGELAPFASEIAGAFSPEGLYLAAEETGARAGLLACGDLAAALDVIALRAHTGPATSLFAVMQIPVAARLVEFALSDDHEELVAALDAVS